MYIYLKTVHPKILPAAEYNYNFQQTEREILIIRQQISMYLNNILIPNKRTLFSKFDL